MIESFQKVARSAMTLNPEERLALTAALDLSLEDEVRSQALRSAVREGINSTGRGDSFALETPAEVEQFLADCLTEAREQSAKSAG